MDRVISSRQTSTTISLSVAVGNYAWNRYDALAFERYPGFTVKARPIMQHEPNLRRVWSDYRELL